VKLRDVTSRLVILDALQTAIARSPEQYEASALPGKQMESPDGSLCVDWCRPARLLVELDAALSQLGSGGLAGPCLVVLDGLAEWTCTLADPAEALPFLQAVLRRCSMQVRRGGSAPHGTASLMQA
jgi:hypothetical protein